MGCFVLFFWTRVPESFYPPGPPPLHKSDFPGSANQHTASVRWGMLNCFPISVPWDLYRSTAGFSGVLVLSRLAVNRWVWSPCLEIGHLALHPLLWRYYSPPQMPSSFQLSWRALASPTERLYKRRAGIHISLRVFPHLEVALPIGAILNPIISKKCINYSQTFKVL